MQQLKSYQRRASSTQHLASCVSLTTQCFRITSKSHKPPTAAAAAAAAAPATWRTFCWVPLLLLLLSLSCQHVAAVGYSYTRFEGPVAGPEHQIQVTDAYGDGSGTRTDYVAKPEYSFAYGVEDGKTRVLQNRKETRDGDAVKGVYSVVDPDGTLRVVKYTADDVHGFQAEVITNGIATLHGHGTGTQHANNAQHQHQQHQQHADESEGAGDGADAQDSNEHDNDVGKEHYKVHEQHKDNDDDDEEEDDDDENAHKAGNGGDGGESDYDEDDQELYVGSSEEGYEEAHSEENEAAASNED